MLASMHALGLMRVELMNDLEARFVVTAASLVWLMRSHHHPTDGGFVRSRSTTCISVLAHQTQFSSRCGLQEVQTVKLQELLGFEA